MGYEEDGVVCFGCPAIHDVCAAGGTLRGESAELGNCGQDTKWYDSNTMGIGGAVACCSAVRIPLSSISSHAYPKARK